MGRSESAGRNIVTEIRLHRHAAALHLIYGMSTFFTIIFKGFLFTSVIINLNAVQLN